MRPFLHFQQKTPGKSKLPQRRGLLLWTYITVFLTIVMLVFFIQVVFGSIDDNVRTSSKINAEQIAGIINILQSSPSNTSYTINLPKMDCLIKITKNSVIFINPKSDGLKTLASLDLSKCNDKECFSVDFARTNIEININPAVQCSEKSFSLARCRNKIIKGTIRDC